MARQLLRRRYSILRQYFSLLLTLFFSAVCFGQTSNGADVYLYLKNNNEFEQKLFTNLKNKFQTKNYTLKPLYDLTQNSGDTPVIFPKPKENEDIPKNIKHVIGVFNSDLAARKNQSEIISHIITSPSVDSQLDLINQLYFNSDRKLTVGIILSHSNEISPSVINEYETKHNVTIKIEYTDDSPLIALTKLGKIDALLALPDSKIFNKKTTTSLIKTAYGREIPMIGFWSGMVEHGASATIYYELQQVESEIVQSVVNKTYLKEKYIWPSQSEISVNAPVIKSLSLNDSIQVNPPQAKEESE